MRRVYPTERCPTCHADPKRPCRRPNGKPLANGAIHVARQSDKLAAARQRAKDAAFRAEGEALHKRVNALFRSYGYDPKNPGQPPLPLSPARMDG